jgi:hypothetical protein
LRRELYESLIKLPKTYERLQNMSMPNGEMPHEQLGTGPMAEFEQEMSPDMQRLADRVAGSAGEAAVGAAAAATVDAIDAALAVPAPAETHSDRDHEVFSLKRDPETYEVDVQSELTLEDYKSITRPEDWAVLERYAKAMEGKRVVFVNPTMEGGGVAMLRPTLVDMFRKLGINAHWYVMASAQRPEEGNPFVFTKQMHNISQRQGGDSRIDQDGKDLHHRWAVEENGPVLARQENIQTADIIVVDDPQPAPLISTFREANPDAKFVWRNHIDTSHALMSDPTTPQGEVASYILDECGVRTVDAVIAHPNPEFMHPGMEDKTYFAPATIDPFDNLNRHLSDAEVQAGVDFINAEIAKKNAEFIAQGREADIQAPLDPEAPNITQIARFDESKGIPEMMEQGVRTRRIVRERLRAQGVPEDQIEAKLPRVVIIGNGSIDDPSGVPMFEKTLRLRREQYPEDAHAITVMRLKHNYDAMNAAMRVTTILNQMSTQEGLETRISDGRNHELPVVISNRGGMSTQLLGEGKSACIVDYDGGDKDGELTRGATFMADLLTDPQKYAEAVAETKEHAESHNRREFTTVGNATRFLRVFDRVLSGQEADKTWLMRELAEQERGKQVAIGATALA